MALVILREIRRGAHAPGTSEHPTARGPAREFPAIVLALALSACCAAADAAPRTRAARPDALYRDYCSVCHGDRGDGRTAARGSLVPPPRDFTDPRLRDTLSRRTMIAVAREGKPGTAMVGWKSQLSEREIEAVVDYIRKTFMRLPPGDGAASHASAVRAEPVLADMSLPMPKGLRGNRERGGRFYRENCATCHGANGDGRGPRATFIDPKPRDFHTADSRAAFNRPALFSAISMGRNGTEMPAWSKVLSEQQVADVAEYVFQEYIRGGEAGGAAVSR